MSRTQVLGARPRPGWRSSRATVLARLGSCTVVVVSVMVMVGWFADIALLRTVAPGLVSMKFNTAVALGAAGVAGCRPPESRARPVLGALVALFGAAVLVEYLLDRSLGFDELVVADHVEKLPGRPSAATALCLLLLGVALALLHSRLRRTVEVIGLAVGTMAWLAVLGYVLGAAFLYSFGPFSTMALHTAVALGLLSLTVLAQVPEGIVPWISDGTDPGSLVMRRMVPAVMLGMPVLAAAPVWAARHGLFDPDLTTVFFIVATTLVVLLTAAGLGRMVAGMDGERGALIDALEHSNLDLEHRVEERTAELRATESQFRVLFDSAPAGITLISDGAIIRANEALGRLLGRSPEDLVGMPIPQLVHHRDLAETRAREDWWLPWAEAELRLLRSDGTWVWCKLTLARMTGPNGEEQILVQVVDATQERSLRDQLRQLAMHDELTGLPNRRSFDEALIRHDARVGREGPMGALLLVDVDDFKAVNDTFGHQVGDAALMAVAEVLRSSVRATDVTARLGGDEFAVLMVDGAAERADAAAQQIIERLRSAVIEGAPPGLKLTVSIGVATWGQHAWRATEVLVHADLAMYEAKAAGRNCWRHAHPRVGS